MTEVTIVGGGLAGMAAALRLLEHEYQVTLFEASSRLGGKAGATQFGLDYNEHGYHIFPLWYRNVWQLVDELGIQNNFMDCTNFNQLRVGEFPEFKILQNAGSIQYFWQNLLSGVLPVPEMFIFIYACLDLMSQPLRRKAFLDQIAVSGFIRSRPYRTERVAKEFQELILKSISVPTYLVSAMTMKTVLEYQVKSGVPIFRILRGNLQEYFIEPFRRRLQDLGCNICTTHSLEQLQVEGSRVTKLHFRDQAGKAYEREVDKVILAIPAEQLAKLLDDSIYVVDPELFNVRYLRSQPMAAINLYFERRIPGIPKDHLNLRGSQFGLSLIDVSQIWEGYDTTVLNVIAADFTTLETLSAEEAIDQIIKELIL